MFVVTGEAMSDLLNSCCVCVQNDLVIWLVNQTELPKQHCKTCFDACSSVSPAVGFMQEELMPSVVNQTELPKRRSEARIDDFSIELDMDDTGKRMFVVTGEAIERFAQMTNWDYYEAANRFQKVLEAAGMLQICIVLATGSFCHVSCLLVQPTVIMQNLTRSGVHS